jgi:hypothetical protein
MSILSVEFTGEELQQFVDGFPRLDPIAQRLSGLASRLVQGLCRNPQLDDRRLPHAACHRNYSVFTYWDQAVPPADVSGCIDSWASSGLRVQRFDRQSADDFLQAAYGGELLAAFRAAHHPAMQADLFRLGLLYAVGRLYVDADDGYSGQAAEELSHFGSGVVALPLAQLHREQRGLSVAEALTRYDDGVFIYLNNAPLFCTARHRLLEITLENALAAIRYRAKRGEKSDFHNDIGPGCLTYSALQYAVEHLTRGGGFDLRLRSAWPSMRLFVDLAYKQTERNWRSRAEIRAGDLAG